MMNHENLTSNSNKLSPEVKGQVYIVGGQANIKSNFLISK